ncbi:hypothetical protein COT75_01340 [Candidatus Beckwithbacteria bacterium CG10_big_fil_rev_8_21_14_0_10_34_10]|uniref:Glycosyl transferase family 1 domain-containing protein n=1 Tax=Candidatus Beckwithbacteria bacterium CG10_big_fil_rev_8_21_14_0_10_34_10 TaxID=1974495 RepID=A0A2H0WAA8_9BACT|nr:MAG: hypothetical protein COT75_01340 [Candidatus Beckwithbacteria bacterium CG10_big_fil_rev_8_21_14_0_10_34_10]
MIAYVVPYLNQYGGIQTFAKNTKKSLKKEHRIKLYNWRLPQNKTFFFLKSKLPKKRNFEIEKAKLIHFWHPLAARGFEKNNFIVSCHGREILPLNLRSFEKKALDNIFQKAKLIHLNSKFTKNLLLKHFPFVDKRKLKVIYPGVSLKNFQKKKNRQIIIGTLSRFNPRKNIVNIIKALNILKSKSKLNFKYYLVGQGMEEKKIKSELKKSNFFWQYKSSLTELEKANFYSKIDIFVLPTLSLKNDVEGFGIVFLEASSFGIPVVASQVDGVKEAVWQNQSGIFTDPKSSEKIAESILNLYKQTKINSQSCQKWAETFSWKKQAQDWKEIYRRLL